MGYIKKFDRFLNEELVMTKTAPAPTTTPTETPTKPRPTAPGIVPTEVPSEQDAPLASAKDVIDRLSNIYTNSSKEEKREIDSYFSEKKD